MGVQRVLKHHILDEIFNGQDVISGQYGGIVWISLHTATPADGNNEVSGNGYSRQQAAWETPGFGMPDGQTWNEDAVDFELMPNTTIEGVGIWDSETNGRLLWNGAIDKTENTLQGDTFRIPAEALVASIA